MHSLVIVAWCSVLCLAGTPATGGGGAAGGGHGKVKSGLKGEPVVYQEPARMEPEQGRPLQWRARRTPDAGQVTLFVPRDFDDEPIIGRAGERMTDGRVAITVVGGRKHPYERVMYGGPLPYEYVVVYDVENVGKAGLTVERFGHLFYDQEGKREFHGWIRFMNLPGSATSEVVVEIAPFSYPPGAKHRYEMRSSGYSKSFNNVCILVDYIGGKSLFVIRITPAELVDKSTGKKKPEAK